MFSSYTLVITLLLHSVCCWISEANVVETKYGKVEGVQMKTPNGKESLAYLGIPYASAPVGALRFKPPVSVEPWSDVLQADKKPKACFQVFEERFIVPGLDWFIDQSTEQSEDCLYLNIWTPNPSPSKAAVMVWIYGGGFATGSCSMDKYDGQILSSESNVIVVCLNYRLGMFGFLYLNSSVAPGNMGLMDQVMALKWVHENIEAFGGDPSRVTVFGESAGSLSIEHHLLLPVSQGLFQRVIFMSGTQLSNFPKLQIHKAFEISKQLIRELGCSVEASTCLSEEETTFDVIESIDASKIMEAYLLLKMGSVFGFYPVIDGLFVTEDNEDSFKAGKFSKDIDVMVGYTKDDGSFMAGVAFNVSINDNEELTEQQFVGVVKASAGLNNNKTIEIIKFLYTNWDEEARTENPKEEMVRFLTDYFFICGVYSQLEYLVENGNKPFWYEFNHIPFSRSKSKWLGSTHGDEIDFIFGKPLDPKEKFHEDEISLSRQYMDLITSFAKYGDPTKSSIKEDWPSCGIDRKEFFNIGLEMKSQKANRNQQCKFWRYLYPELKRYLEV